MLALVLGIELTLGQFQFQFWTAGLIVLTALCRAIGRETPWRRVAALSATIGWAGAVAAVQLAQTWEFVRFVGFTRSPTDLFLYAFPPSHWAQLAFPGVYLGLRGDALSDYWFSLATSPGEACLYIGLVPLILAGVGLFAPKDRSIVLWCGIAVLAFVMASVPRFWPEGYTYLIKVPGFNLFRCPARYTILTSMGLCLLAGVGFDRLVSRRRFWGGYALAATVAGVAASWVDHLDVRTAGVLAACSRSWAQKRGSIESSSGS